MQRIVTLNDVQASHEGTTPEHQQTWVHQKIEEVTRLLSALCPWAETADPELVGKFATYRTATVLAVARL